MLGFLILCLKGMRIKMFQLSGFYCTVLRTCIRYIREIKIGNPQAGGAMQSR